MMRWKYWRKTTRKQYAADAIQAAVLPCMHKPLEILMFARLLRFVLLLLSLLIPLQASFAMPASGQDDCCVTQTADAGCHENHQDMQTASSDMMCCQLHAATPVIILPTPPLLAARGIWQNYPARTPDSCVHSPPEHPPRTA
jgi:hypothetical protein